MNSMIFHRYIYLIFASIKPKPNKQIKMKTNAIITLLVAGAMSFTACTNKIDEKTVADINQFGTDWTALGEKATNWSNDLAQTTTQAKEFAAKQTEIVNATASSKDAAWKTKVNE